MCAYFKWKWATPFYLVYTHTSNAPRTSYLSNGNFIKLLWIFSSLFKTLRIKMSVGICLDQMIYITILHINHPWCFEFSCVLFFIFVLDLKTFHNPTSTPHVSCSHLYFSPFLRSYKDKRNTFSIWNKNLHASCYTLSNLFWNGFVPPKEILKLLLQTVHMRIWLYMIIKR